MNVSSDTLVNNLVKYAINTGGLTRSVVAFESNVDRELTTRFSAVSVTTLILVGGRTVVDLPTDLTPTLRFKVQHHEGRFLLFRDLFHAQQTYVVAPSMLAISPHLK